MKKIERAICGGKSSAIRQQAEALILMGLLNGFINKYGNNYLNH